ncbi:hypothetical protein [Aeromicrobium sp.]|uniref:DUF7373 family lipoprotein n=1 Tax=Aeromicrobium sp. TaxID=1871063 RepID=UPI0025BAE384|nr:hypothetical protein [Aeromicrobium sp.]MCK5891240.1 hypothetical protein [Aeromicrobium sp.]
MSRRTVAMLATAAVLVSVLTACGDDQDPDPDPTPASTFDPDALDLGRIDPTATDVSTALTAASSQLVAAYDLGRHLVLPQQLRSGLDRFGVETGALVGPGDYDFALSEVGAPVVAAGAQTGLLTRRVDTGGDAWITTALVQLPDAAAAEAAVQAGAAALVAPDPTGLGASMVVEPVASDDQAVAVVTTTPDIANQVYVLRAYGPFLAYAWVYDIDGDMDDARAYAADFLADQELALDDVDPVAIPATPRVRDLDPTGLWGLTLAPDSSGGLSSTAYVAGSHAAQTRQIDADGIARAFSRAGVSRVASNVTSLYATENDEGARTLLDAFVDQGTGLGLVQADPPPGLDEAVCLANQDEDAPGLTLWPEFLCFSPFGAYLLESSGVSLEEAQQRISAQALLIFEEQQDQRRSSG